MRAYHVVGGSLLVAAAALAGCSDDRVTVPDAGGFRTAGAGAAAQATPVVIDKVYSGMPAREPGVINLANPHVYVEILDVERYLGRQAAAAGVRIGPSFEAGTPAEEFEILDLDGDGNRDIRLRFSLNRLFGEANLGLATTELQVWGRDGATTYGGSAAVTVQLPDGSALLWDNGGIVTHPGAGADGADVSMASPAPHNSGGANVRRVVPGDGEFWIADDFVVPEGGWDLGSVVTYAYETGGEPLWDGATLEIRRYSFNGPLVATASTTHWQWTGTYRVGNGVQNLGSTARPVYALTFGFESVRLEPGPYYIVWQVEGGYSAYVPYVMQADPAAAHEPRTVFGSAFQFVGGSAWMPVLEAPGAETPFLLLGQSPGQASLPSYSAPQAGQPRRAAAPRLAPEQPHHQPNELLR